MKRSLSALVSTAVLAAGLMTFAPAALADEAAAVCLPTGSAANFERVDRKTLRFTTKAGQSVLVSTHALCNLKEGDRVELIQRGETACLTKGDKMRSWRAECRVNAVTPEAPASGS